jgi:hypothetical protein
MSTINVDVVSPQSGNNVEVNGVEIRGYNQAIKIGPGSGDNLGIFSLAIGTLALNASTGQSNTAVGFLSGANLTTGFGNTALGTNSLKESENTSNNTALGYSSLIQSKPNGNGANTAVGSQALYDSTTGNENTAIGFSAGAAITTGDNNTCIGNGSQASIGTVSHEVTIGDTRITALRCAVTSITSLSDARDKKNIEESTYGLDFVDSLKPVKFEWDTRDGAKKDIKDLGFIAQDLKEVDDEYLGLVYSENPEKLEASYGRLIPVLVKAIQELSEEIKQLKNK